MLGGILPVWSLILDFIVIFSRLMAILGCFFGFFFFRAFFEPENGNLFLYWHH